MRTMLVLLLDLAFSSTALAQSGTGGMFHFFHGEDIDYWGQGLKVKDPLSLSDPGSREQEQKSEGFSGSSVVRNADSKPFAWSSYRNPRAPEFWDDGGDWIPPRPFREAAADPSKENVKEYLAWQSKKTEVLTKFQDALTQSVGQGAPLAQSPTRTLWSQLKIAYFYQTTCPHCRASRDTVEDARRLGAKTTFIQLDHKSEPPLHTPSIPYDKSWNEEFHVSSTPTWVFKMNSKTATHSGALTLSELESIVSTLSTEAK